MFNNSYSFMQNFIRLVYLMRILLHLSTYFPNTPRISCYLITNENTSSGNYKMYLTLVKQRIWRVSAGWQWWLLCQPIRAVTSRRTALSFKTTGLPMYNVHNICLTLSEMSFARFILKLYLFQHLQIYHLFNFQFYSIQLALSFTLSIKFRRVWH